MEQTTEQKILEAAKKVFLERGLESARMQEIADAAGINKALLHYYFRSKEKLFDQIFNDVIQGHFPKVVRILDADTSVFKKIEDFCEVYIHQMQQTPYVPFFIMNEINRDAPGFLKRVIGREQPPVMKFVMQLQIEIAAGIIKPINPFQLLMNVLSLCLFPFLGRPMIQHITGMNLQQFNTLMEERKKLVPQLIIDSIKA